MGMDLIPRRKGAESLRYNWSGWSALVDFLDGVGVNTSDLAGTNDGFLIPSATCHAIANAIEAQAPAYNATYGGGGYGDDPATDHAKAWRESGGMRQY